MPSRLQTRVLFLFPQIQLSGFRWSDPWRADGITCQPLLQLQGPPGGRALTARMETQVCWSLPGSLVSLDRRCFPVAAAWSPSGLEDRRHFRPGGPTATSVLEDRRHFRPGGPTATSGLEDGRHFRPGGRTAPSQLDAMQFPPKAERTGNSYERAGCLITSGSQAASGERPRGSPASPRFRESGAAARVVSCLSCCRPGTG